MFVYSFTRSGEISEHFLKVLVLSGYLKNMMRSLGAMRYEHRMCRFYFISFLDYEHTQTIQGAVVLKIFSSLHNFRKLLSANFCPLP